MLGRGGRKRKGRGGDGRGDAGSDSRCDWLIVGLGNPGREHADTRHNVGFMVADLLAERWGLGRERERYRGRFAEGRIPAEIGGVPAGDVLAAKTGAAGAEAGAAGAKAGAAGAEAGAAGAEAGAEGAEAGAEGAAETDGGQGDAGAGGRLSAARPRVAVLWPQTYMNDAGRSVGPARGALRVPLDRVLVIHDEIDIPFGDIRARVGGGLAGHNGLKSLRHELGSPDFVRVRVGVGRPDSSAPEIVSAYVLGRFREPAAEVHDLIERAADTVQRIVLGQEPV